MVTAYLQPSPERPIGGHLTPAPSSNLSEGRLVVVEMGGTKRFIRPISVTDEEQKRVAAIFKRLQDEYDANAKDVSFNLSALNVVHYNGRDARLNLTRDKGLLDELQEIAKKALKRENSETPEFASEHSEKSRENPRKNLAKALSTTDWTGRLHAMHNQEQLYAVVNHWLSQGPNQNAYQTLWNEVSQRRQQFFTVIEQVKKDHPNEAWILEGWEKKLDKIDFLAICCAIRTRVDRKNDLESPWLQDQTQALEREMEQFNQFIQEQPAGPEAANSFFTRLISGFKIPARDPSLKGEEKAYSRDAVLLATRKEHGAARRHFAHVTEDPIEWILLEVAETGSTDALLDHPLFNVKAYPDLDRDLRAQFK